MIINISLWATFSRPFILLATPICFPHGTSRVPSTTLYLLLKFISVRWVSSSCTSLGRSLVALFCYFIFYPLIRLLQKPLLEERCLQGRVVATRTSRAPSPTLYLLPKFISVRRVPLRTHFVGVIIGRLFLPFFLPPLSRLRRHLPSMRASNTMVWWQYYTLILKTPKFLFFLSIMDNSKKQCK